MAITINVSVLRQVPQQNDEGLTLVVLKTARAKNSEHQVPTLVYSVEDLYNKYSYMDETGETPVLSKLAAYELYVAEYLLRAGTSILVYPVASIASGFTATDALAIEDLEVLNYKMMTVPYLFIEDYEGTVPAEITEIMTFAKEHDVQLFLDAIPTVTEAEADGIVTDLASVLSAKVEIAVNAGIAAFKSFNTDAGLDFTDFNDVATPFYGLPASATLIARKAQLLAAEKPYIPVAGEINGLITEYTKLYRKLSTAEKTALQAKGLNVVTTKVGLGILFTAQNTMYQKLVTDTDNNPLLRSHAVTQALWFKRKLKAIAERTMFSVNGQKTWDALSLSAGRLFKETKAKEGLISYRVLVGKGITMTQADVDAGIIKATFAYKPIKPVEAIEMNLVIEESAGTYDIAIQGGIL